MADTAKLVALRKEFIAKQAAAAKITEEAGADLDMEKVKCLGEGLTTEQKVQKFREANTELVDLKKKLDAEIELVRAADNIAELGDWAKHRGEPLTQPVHEGKGGGEDEEPKGIGDLFVESEQFKALRENKGVKQTMGWTIPKGGLKTTFSTSAGWAPQSIRIPGLVIPYATRPIQVLDVIPTGPTSQAAVVYMEETTFTNNAAERTEANAYAESALALTQASETVRSVGTSLPVTDEQLDDVPGVAQYLNDRLGFMVRQKLDYQILQGDGNAPNLAGILNDANIDTYAKAGGDSSPDAFYKAMTQIMVDGYAMPTTIFIHPNDWQSIRLLRTSDGVYIWGSPSMPGPETMWGLPVVKTQCVTENTGLVGDLTMCRLYERAGLDVQVGYDSDDFTKGLRTIRAGVRVAMVTYRGAAFCTVTSI